MFIILHNARVFVPPEEDTQYRFDTCLVIDHETGLIAHVGSVKDKDVVEIYAKSEGGVSWRNMNGLVVLPGFIDSHMHILQTGEALQKLDLSKCRSLQQIRGAIRTYARENPSLPRLLCRGWFHPATDGNEQASQLDDLDERPIYVDAEDLHSTWCNSAALKEMAVEDMDDPPAGKIHRDESGKPSGLMSETAAVGIVWPFISSKSSREDKVRFLKDTFDAYVAAGYTGVVEMATDEGVWDTLQAYRQLHGELPMRLAAHWFVFPRESTEENLKQVNRAIELNKQFNVMSSPHCRITGIKVMCDGTVDACTAHLLEPYEHTGKNEQPAWTVETLLPVLRRADDAGLQCALHAIGDGAIRVAIDALEMVNNPKGRHRIEHLEMCSPEDVPRLGKLGIIASVQPVHSDPANLSAWVNLIGPSRCKHIFPYGAFAKASANVAIGTDSPTAPLDPLPNLYAATTRRSASDPHCSDQTTPQFALDMLKAVVAYTSGAAYSCREEHRAGCLRNGLAANLVAVDMEWDANRLLDAKVMQTWIAGSCVYQRT